MDEVRALMEQVINCGSLIDLVLSNARQKGQGLPHKASVRPVLLKGDLLYQFAFYVEKQVLHENLPAEEAKERIIGLLASQFRQAQFFTEQADYQVLVSKRGISRILKRPASKTPGELAHNRRKEYLIPENEPNPFLIRLGVMSQQGKVLASKYDKFRQLNRYLEMVADILPALPKGDHPLRIVDFGCGKSYLTFALYYYLVERLGMKVRIEGLDLKRDVIDHCSSLAKELGYSGLRFELGDIAAYQAEEGVDMVVSLHACDTATDAALAQAVRWGAKVIMAVPCCQHELLQQMHNPIMHPLEKHGIVKERLATLVTDSMRASILEIMGYSVQIVEFIDTEHTPKNLMIRAVYTGQISKRAVEEYLRLKEFWHAAPHLEQALDQSLIGRLV